MLLTWPSECGLKFSSVVEKVDIGRAFLDVEISNIVEAKFQ